MIKRVVKGLAHALLGRYRWVRIYRANEVNSVAAPTTKIDVRELAGGSDILNCDDAMLRDHAWFADSAALALGLFAEGELAAACVVWDWPRCADPILPVKDKSGAVLVDVTTGTKWRRRGFATSLITAARNTMARRGNSNLYATVWHNNWQSIKAFERAGWTWEHTAIEVFPLGYRRGLRLKLPAKG